MHRDLRQDILHKCYVSHTHAISVPYSGKLSRGRKLSQIGEKYDFSGITCFCLAKDAIPQTLWRNFHE